jgi:hypothetical protein
VIQAEKDEDPMIKTLANVGVYNRIHLNSVGDLLEPMNVPQLRDPEDNDDFDSILGQVSGVSIDHNKSFLSIMAVTVQLQLPSFTNYELLDYL